MEVGKLIEELKKLPKGAEVCLVDWRKNLHHASDEYAGEGIMTEFNVEYIEEYVNKPFIAIQFINDDYQKDGSPNYGASILNCE